MNFSEPSVVCVFMVRPQTTRVCDQPSGCVIHFVGRVALGSITTFP